uniref:Retrovirus-related Pol polyprotein from transposon TNT 1-94-like beta-barrel domain-containing protein n=1 Tax=Vitis vinifera TaxID=29760 RepID=A5BE50_VITVI|nr:hypothetical protein VITISV_020532 [Vitis vinifera]
MTFGHNSWRCILSNEKNFPTFEVRQIHQKSQKMDMKNAFTTNQSGKSLSKYYGELTESFCELDHRDKVVMKDPEDIATYRKSIERQQVHIFLVGLDGDFEQVRGEILRKDPLPDLEECYALIRREANWQDQSKTNHPKINPNIDKSTFKCTHCNKTGHTKSCCFEIMGYPDWWDHNHDQWKKDSKKTSTAAVAEIKIETNVTEKASALVAATDYGGKFLNTSTPVINSAWIIDSGATDHMTFDSRQVSPFRPSSQKIVSIANGNTTPVIRKGSLTLTDTLNLDSILVVPSLDYNLLSVSQITTTLSCIVIFWPEFCVFKDIQIRQMIGCGIKRGKLYYLDLQSNDSNKLRQALMADESEGEKKKSEIWL